VIHDKQIMDTKTDKTDREQTGGLMNYAP